MKIAPSEASLGGGMTVLIGRRRECLVPHWGASCRESLV